MYLPNEQDDSSRHHGMHRTDDRRLNRAELDPPAVDLDLPVSPTGEGETACGCAPHKIARVESIRGALPSVRPTHLQPTQHQLTGL